MYVKTKWEDRLVEFPNKYKDQNNNEYIFTQVPGQITKDGTPVVAEYMNNMENGIYDNQLFSYQTTLLTTGWTLNETTNLYEYNIAKEDITENTCINVNGDLINQQKLSDLQVNSYNGYFILSTSELPTEDVDVTICYQLANMVLGGSENVGEN